MLTSLTLSGLLAGCTTVTTSDYEATALVTYTWQVEYLKDSEGRRQRFEKFAETSLLNRNGQRPDDAVTGPDDQGLWWPALPPRPTVDEMEERQQGQEHIGTPNLIKKVDYSLSFDMNGQPRILPTNYSVYRQVIKAYSEQRPLELTLGVNNGSVEKAEPR